GLKLLEVANQRRPPLQLHFLLRRLVSNLFIPVIMELAATAATAVLSLGLLFLSPLRLHLNHLFLIQFLYHRTWGWHQLLIGMVDNGEDSDLNHMVQIQIGEAIAVHTLVEIEIRIGNPTQVGGICRRREF
ncbi:hypothetical protein HAX54_014549, partial [Datura stramonium]|nr:hypothetical protein [Datura stramonium]